MEGEYLLLKKYQVSGLIGAGSFGTIYKCRDINSDEEFAVKMEKKDKGEGQLQYEIRLYQIFHGITGIAHMYDFGKEDNKFFMVMDLLGDSLQNLLQLCGKKFSIATTLKIGLQCITRIEQIHRKGFVHRDIKSSNFVVGLNRGCRTIYIIDFGLAKKYKDLKTGVHIASKGGKSLVGTARYASIASHDGFEQCRRDDLESLGYVLLYFLKGVLPWQGIQIPNKVQKYAEIGRLKKTIPIQTICGEESASVFVKYFEYLKALEFEQEPNYELIKKIMREELLRRKEDALPLDWEERKIKRK